MATTFDDVAKLLQNAPSRALHMLRLFESMHSFASVADSMGMDNRTVANSLKLLDREFLAAVGEGLLTMTNGRHELTALGSSVAKLLAASHYALVTDVLQVAANPGLHLVNVPVAMECLPRLSDLAEVCREAGIALEAVVRRSADFTEPPTVNSRENGGRAGAVSVFPFALYSQCMPEMPAAPFRVGTSVTRDSRLGGRRMQILVLDVAPFKVIAPRSIFGDAEAVTFDDLWSLRSGPIIPRGGAVKDLLDAVEPDWPRRIHRRSTDLEATLALLRAPILAPDAAMIAHGSDESLAALRSRTTPDMAIYQLDPTVASQYVAVTGFVRDLAVSRSLSDAQRDAWMTIWGKAIDLWGATV